MDRRWSDRATPYSLCWHWWSKTREGEMEKLEQEGREGGEEETNTTNSEWKETSNVVSSACICGASDGIYLEEMISSFRLNILPANPSHYSSLI